MSGNKTEAAMVKFLEGIRDFMVMAGAMESQAEDESSGSFNSLTIGHNENGHFFQEYTELRTISFYHKGKKLIDLVENIEKYEDMSDPDPSKWALNRPIKDGESD